jgi:hypothetical protein
MNQQLKNAILEVLDKEKFAEMNYELIFMVLEKTKGNGKKARKTEKGPYKFIFPAKYDDGKYMFDESYMAEFDVDRIKNLTFVYLCHDNGADVPENDPKYLFKIPGDEPEEDTSILVESYEAYTGNSLLKNISWNFDDANSEYTGNNNDNEDEDGDNYNANDCDYTSIQGELDGERFKVEFISSGSKGYKQSDDIMEFRIVSIENSYN